MSRDLTADEVDGRGCKVFLKCSRARAYGQSMGRVLDELTFGELFDRNGLLIIRCERCRRERHQLARELLVPRSRYVVSMRFRCKVCGRASRSFLPFIPLLH